MQLRSGKITKTNINNQSNTNVPSVDYANIQSISSNKQLELQITTIFKSNTNNKSYKNLEYSDITLMSSTIKKLLVINDYTSGRDKKYPIALLIMLLLTTRLGKKFIKQYYNFSRTVYWKLIEFIGDSTIETSKKEIFILIHNELLDAGAIQGERINKDNIKIPHVINSCSNCGKYH